MRSLGIACDLEAFRDFLRGQDYVWQKGVNQDRLQGARR